MSIIVNFNGTPYTIPTVGESGWGANVTSFLVDLAQSCVTASSPGALTNKVIAAQPGTASAPAFSFAQDTDTGMYQPGVGQLRLTTNGVDRLNIDASGLVTVPGPFKAATIDNTPIGATIPSTGAFTTLSASSGLTVGGQGITYSSDTHRYAFKWDGSYEHALVDGTDVGRMVLLNTSNNATVPGNLSVSGTLGVTGSISAASNLFVTGESQANSTFRISNSGAYFYSDANYTQIAMDGGNWRWSYQRSTGRMSYLRGYDGVELFVVDPAGNAAVPSGFTAGGSINAASGTVSCGAGFAMNQAGSGGTWIADANWVYKRFSGAWGWQWDRNSGRLHFVNGSGASLLQIAESGIGIAYAGLGGVYANWSAFGWDGFHVWYAGNGGGAGYLVLSGTDTGAGYTGIYKMNIAPGGSAVYGWYAGSTAIGWSAATVSDRRIKSNIRPAGDALAAINKMKVYACDATMPEFATRHRDYSIIADEIEEIMPSAVAEKPEDENLFQMVDNLTLTCALIRAVQQLSAKVEALEARK